MNILVLGSGGREHAIVWSLANDEKDLKLFCAPGNAGTSAISENVNLDIVGEITNNNTITPMAPYSA